MKGAIDFGANPIGSRGAHLDGCNGEREEQLGRVRFPAPEDPRQTPLVSSRQGE